MANYSVDLQRTASTTASVGVLNSEATLGAARRMKVYDITFGSEATPADAAILWKVQRCTLAGTSTAVVIALLDLADGIAQSEAGENHTIEPTYTADTHLIHLALNQRATYRWVAAPGGELVTPATDENGVGVQTDTISSGTPVVTCQMHYSE
jgi:hypothetical protein